MQDGTDAIFRWRSRRMGSDNLGTPGNQMDRGGERQYRYFSEVDSKHHLHMMDGHRHRLRNWEHLIEIPGLEAMIAATAQMGFQR